MSALLPELAQASEHAVQLDALSRAFFGVILLLTVPVFVLMFAFAIRYRRGKRADRDQPARRNLVLEVSWSVVPFLLIVGFFVVSARQYFELRTAPGGELRISVVAKQWMWKFQHPEGQAEINELHVPTGQPVLLTMASADVIHSLYVPALRIKQDVLPGRYTQLWFTPVRPGSYRILCAEFCGASHSAMGGRLVVMTPGDYGRWLAAHRGGSSLAAEGEGLYARLGCGACHDTRGDDAPQAPPLRGLAGREVRLADGTTRVADDEYLRESLLTPNAAVVAGYRPIMPTYRGAVGEEDIARLVAYLRSTGTEGSAP